MKSYYLITPEGTRDLLFDECTACKNEQEKLRAMFTAHGYSEVITPALEFYDVFFNTKARSFNQEDMYKLTDGKGRLMVLRPDSTMPIARIAATRLKDSVYPLKLFYCQNIYRSNPKMAGRDDEIMQSGIEIIGGDEQRSDIEALSLAAKVLNSCGSEDVRLEIGDNAFYKYLLDKLSAQQDEELIRSLIESKNTPELKKYLAALKPEEGKAKYAEMLLALPSLFGGSEVFQKAEKLFTDTELTKRLERLRDTYDTLCRLNAGDTINVDLGLVNKAEYYTGIIFRGYIEEYGQAVISGGRYDTLIGSFGVPDKAAIGFAANVNAIAAMVTAKSGTLSKSAEVLVYAAKDNLVEGIRHCNELISSGITAEFAACDSQEAAMEYAKAKGISRLCIIDGDISEKAI